MTDAGRALRRLLARPDLPGDVRAELDGLAGMLLPEVAVAEGVPRTELGPGETAGDVRAGEAETVDEAESARDGDPSGGLGLARYRLLGPLGWGGSATVVRVWDRHLATAVAMKIRTSPVEVGGRNSGDTRAIEAGGSAGAGDQLWREARLLAALRHPVIPPVYDVGRLGDGRPYFTLAEVPGASIGVRLTGSPPLLEEGVAWVLDVASALAHAHEVGVVHGDVSPGNVIVSPAGVRLVDWGLARAWPPDGDEAGAVRGTPGFAAPELAAGSPPSPRSDVYALGRVLGRVVEAVGPGEAGGLGGIVGRACAGEPGDRYEDGAALQRALTEWLHHRRRAAEAASLLARGQPRLEEARKRRERAIAAGERAAELLADVAAHEPVARKREAWALEEAAAADERAAIAAEAAWESTLRAALSVDPTYAPALDALVELYSARLRAAERVGDPPAAILAEALLRGIARPEQVAWLDAPASISLATLPAGAPVTARPLVLRDRRLVPGEGRALGVTPISDVPLAPGSWWVEVAGEVGISVAVGRGERWTADPPGRSVPLVIPRRGEVTDEEALVPAGWFLAGGDPLAHDAAPARRVWLASFVMRRHPITNAEYLTFLNDLVSRGEAERAAEHAPADRHAAGEPWRPVYSRDADGGYHLADDSAGTAWRPDWPVTLVTWFDAQAYAAWLAARTGQPWRLPHELEWEKAARGADGRTFPWGSFFDATWACTGPSHAGPMTRAAVTDWPLDESPYGVRGMAGNVRDWCANGYLRGGEPGPEVDVTAPGTGPYRIIRGGAWAVAPDLCRAAGRFANPPDRRLTMVGFRLCRSWPG